MSYAEYVASHVQQQLAFDAAQREQHLHAIKRIFSDYAQTITDAQAEIIYSALQQIANK